MFPEIEIGDTIRVREDAPVLNWWQRPYLGQSGIVTEMIRVPGGYAYTILFPDSKTQGFSDFAIQLAEAK